MLLIAGLLVPARPASAADPLPVVTTETTAELPGHAIQAHKARCPGRMHVISGGAIATAADATMMIDSYPIDGKDADRKPDDGWKVTMHNLGDAPTQVRVLAVCTAVGSYRYLKKSGVARSDEGSTSVTVGCPAKPNKRTTVTGGGVKYSKGLPSQSLAATTPDDGPDEHGTRDDAWRVAVNNQTGDRDLPMTAYAICETSSPLIYLGLGSAVSVNTNATHTQTSACGGNQVLGGGVRFDPLNNAGYIEFTGPSVPNPGEGPDGWTSQVRNPGTNSAAWYDPICYWLG